MNNVKYSEKDMAALIGEVETQFADHLKKAEKESETTLAKSEEISEEVVAVEATETESAEIMEKSEESEFNYDEEDFTEMSKLYGSMNKAEAEAHYKSVKNILFGEEATKTEAKIEKSEAEVEVKIEKSEDLVAKSEFDSVQEENKTLRKSIEDLTNAVKGFNKGRAPKQKAVTQIQYLKKSEVAEVKEEEKAIDSLSKTEIAKKLSGQIRKGASSEDKEKINAYYIDKTSIDTIKHLL